MFVLFIAASFIKHHRDMFVVSKYVDITAFFLIGVIKIPIAPLTVVKHVEDILGIFFAAVCLRRRLFWKDLGAAM